MSLPGEDVKKYKTCQSLAHDLVLILEGILNQELKSPWSAHQLTDSQGSSQSKDVGAQRPAIARELSSDGSAKDSALMLQEAGFAVGQHVRRKADQETGMLMAMEHGRVKLRQPSGSIVRVSIDSFLAGHWQVFTPKPEPQTVEDLSLYSPAKFHEYERQMLLACLYMDMHELMKKHGAGAGAGAGAAGAGAWGWGLGPGAWSRGPGAGAWGLGPGAWGLGVGWGRLGLALLLGLAGAAAGGCWGCWG